MKAKNVKSVCRNKMNRFLAHIKNDDVRKTMTRIIKKATHANVHATEADYGGYRATVMAGKTFIASCHFPCKGWGKSGEAYAEMKRWLAGFGVS